jgi:hypothetical protein
MVNRLTHEMISYAENEDEWYAFIESDSYENDEQNVEVVTHHIHNVQFWMLEQVC